MKAWGTGDDGTTGLFGHERVPKDHPRPEAYGTLDEASSFLGVAKCAGVEPRTREMLEDVQQDLYYVMGEIATTEENLSKLEVLVGESHVRKLDSYCEEIEASVKLPNVFVLPGSCPTAAQLDVSRTVVRRAERVCVRLVREEISSNSQILRYLNRLSTLLYLLARYEEGHKGVLPALTKPGSTPKTR